MKIWTIINYPIHNFFIKNRTENNSSDWPEQADNVEYEGQLHLSEQEQEVNH